MTIHRRDFLQSTLASTLLAHAGWNALDAQATTPNGPAAAASPFLEGNFAPVREEVTADNLRVIGRLPRELEGMYVRNGPNPQYPPLGRYHWFDGDGMVHGVRIREGRASYRNRFIRTEGWEAERRAGRGLWRGMLEAPDVGHLLQGRPVVKNAANTALVWHHGRLLALWEGGHPHALRVPGLETIGPQPIAGRGQPFTAHPKIDPASGDMMFFGYALQRPFLRYGVCNARGQVVHTTAIDLPRAVMIHDFAITQNHVLFLDLPETFSLERMLRGQPPLRFEPGQGARVGILRRRAQGRDIRWFPIAPCFVFHTMNAYEEGDEVNLLACRMREVPAFAEGRPRAPGAADNATTPFLYRWRFNLRTGAVREQALDDVPAEFPRINEGRIGRPARFGYVAKAQGELFTGLVKFDLETGRSEQHLHGVGRFGGEGVFVPRPEARAEDDGWLVTYVHDQRDNRSEMIVVEGRNFRAPPVARILLPARVPFGFHGIWISGAETGPS